MRPSVPLYPPPVAVQLLDTNLVLLMQIYESMALPNIIQHLISSLTFAV